MDDGLCRRICVTQIPSARKPENVDNARINNSVARRAGVPFSFATFLLGKQKKSRFQKNKNHERIQSPRQRNGNKKSYIM